MTRRVAFAVVAVTTCAALAGVSVHALGRARRGNLAFDTWEIIGGKAHGGQYLTVNNIRLYYATYGKGRPVLVLHGGAGSSMTMHYQIQALAANHLVIAPDSRGRRRSTDADLPLTYRLMADDMVQLLDHLGIGRVDVVGWSDGGIIGLDLAMRYPQRVGRLVVIGANYDVDGLVKMPDPNAIVPPAPGFYRRNAPDPTQWPVMYRKVVAMWRTQPHYTIQDLNKIKSPTLVMAGEFDAIKRVHTQKLASAISGSSLDVIAGGGHALPGERPNTVNAAILRFLDSEPL